MPVLKHSPSTKELLMANPFLVLGGVAVGVVTAGIGVMQVPGWIDSANDSAVRNDLSQVAIGEEAAYTVSANYTDLDGLIDGTSQDNAGTEIATGVEIQVSSGVELAVALDATSDEWAAIGESKSGHLFVRTSEGADVFTSDSKVFADAITDIQAQIDAALGADVVTIGGVSGAPTIAFD